MTTPPSSRVPASNNEHRQFQPLGVVEGDANAQEQSASSRLIAGMETAVQQEVHFVRQPPAGASLSRLLALRAYITMTG